MGWLVGIWCCRDLLMMKDIKACFSIETFYACDDMLLFLVEDFHCACRVEATGCGVMSR